MRRRFSLYDQQPPSFQPRLSPAIIIRATVNAGHKVMVVQIAAVTADDAEIESH
jgi:hypothetical protein